jgi:hypothetical protein
MFRRSLLAAGLHATVLCNLFHFHDNRIRAVAVGCSTHGSSRSFSSSTFTNVSWSGCMKIRHVVANVITTPKYRRAINWRDIQVPFRRNGLNKSILRMTASTKMCFQIVLEQRAVIRHSEWLIWIDFYSRNSLNWSVNHFMGLNGCCNWVWRRYFR